MCSSASIRATIAERITMSEIIFEVTEDEIDGGYAASALGYGIHTQGDTLDELRQNIKEAVACYFDATPTPKRFRLDTSKIACYFDATPTSKRFCLDTSNHKVTP